MNKSIVTIIVIIFTCLSMNLSFSQKFSDETEDIIEAILNSDTLHNVIDYDSLTNSTITIVEHEFTPDSLEITVPEFNVTIISAKEIEEKNIKQFFHFSNAKVKNGNALIKFIYCTDDIRYRVILKETNNIWSITNFKAQNKYR